MRKAAAIVDKRYLLVFWILIGSAEASLGTSSPVVSSWHGRLIVPPSKSGAPTSTTAAVTATTTTRRCLPSFTTGTWMTPFTTTTSNVKNDEPSAHAGAAGTSRSSHRDVLLRRKIDRILREERERARKDQPSSLLLRAGGAPGFAATLFSSSSLEEGLEQSTTKNTAVLQVLDWTVQTLLQVAKFVLPPTVALTKSVVAFYSALPRDVLIAQAGLIYCFAGGYYPTLFSSLVAARHCGWEVAVQALQDMTDEALKVVDLVASNEYQIDDESMDRRQVFFRQTSLVLKTVDPQRINQAAGALYTTWLGVSAVLEKEYARVISLSLTLAHAMERVLHWVLEPPMTFVVSSAYHKWIPVMIGWGCKGVAINVAWRIQRVLTASTSAMAGGLMFARACFRMLHKRGFRLFGLIAGSGEEVVVVQEEDEYGNKKPTTKTVTVTHGSYLDEVVGFLVAGIGFWTQIQAQYKNNFSFVVPFPLNLITWPFDLAERCIQWYITKD